MRKDKEKDLNKLMEEALVPEEEQPYKVPENWVWVRLGKVALINPPKYVPSDIKDNFLTSFIPMSAVSEVSGVIETPEFREYKDVKKGYTNFLDGDIIFAKITPCMENGKAAIAKDLVGGFGFGSTEFHVLRATKAIENKLIYYMVRSEVFRKQAKSIMTGAVGQQRVHKNFLVNYPLPLPPLPEQKRIVDRLELLWGKINEAKLLIEEAGETFADRRAAILAKAFRGKLTRRWREEHPDIEPAERLLERVKAEKEKLEGTRKGRKKNEELPPIDPPNELPEGWCWVRLGELGSLDRGRSKHRPRNDERLFIGDYPFIQTGDIARSGGKINRHSQTLSEFGLKQSRLFPTGTVAITIAANIADTAILTYPACFPDSVVGFQPYGQIASSEFVEFFFRTIKNDLEHYAPATAQKNINLEILNQVAVPLPSKSEQLQILKLLDSLYGCDEEVEKMLAFEEDLNIITQSILSKAFRGKLGTNNPGEESTLGLLKQALISNSV